MKNKIFNIGMFVAIALMAGYNVYSSQKPVEMSDMSLANVEALAACGEVPYDTGMQSYNAVNGCHCLSCSEVAATNCHCR